MPPKKKGTAGPKKGSKAPKKGSAKSSKSKGSGKRKRSKKRSSSRTPRSPVDPLAHLPTYGAENIREAFQGLEMAESPINLTLNILKKIKLPPIEWYNYDAKANTMKLTNTGYSVVLTGLWGELTKPFVKGGPLMNEYEFSQLHFHWGLNSNEGSEHRIDGVSYPFEMHAVFFNKNYRSHDKAKLEEDGMIIFVYMFKIQPTNNEKLIPITNSLNSVIPAYGESPIDPVALMTILKTITDDYIVYLGVMKYKCKHGVMWITSRETFGISEEQLALFRKLQNKEGKPIPKTFRDVQDVKNRPVFLVLPAATDQNLVLHPLFRPRSASAKRSRSGSKKRGKHSPSKKKGKKSASKSPKGKKTASKKPKKK